MTLFNCSQSQLKCIIECGSRIESAFVAWHQSFTRSPFSPPIVYVYAIEKQEEKHNIIKYINVNSAKRVEAKKKKLFSCAFEWNTTKSHGAGWRMKKEKNYEAEKVYVYSEAYIYILRQK